jgi:hypothetical protein
VPQIRPAVKITCNAWSKLLGEEAVAMDVVLMIADFGTALKDSSLSFG